MNAKKTHVVSVAVSAVILAIVLAANIAVGVLQDTIDTFVVGYKDGGSSASTERADGEDLAEQIQGEGTVLVQNTGDLLPLDKNEVSSVNVFGWSSTAWIYSGSGSGQVINATTDLLGALTNYGISYNSDITSMYSSFQSKREYTAALSSFNYEYSRLYEPSISDTSYYTADMLSTAKAYSDTAIVVIGRTTGESNDCPKVQYKRTTKGGSIVEDDSRTYLEISTEEEELLEYVGANYENVIVLINSTNVMELGFMETIEGLDACMIVGTTGTAAANAIPKLLYGEITPSGKLADTYAYDLSTSSTYTDTGSGSSEGYNASTYTDINYYTNGAGLYPTTATTGNNSKTTAYQAVNYTDYREGIYVGYKWYETADAEGFWDTTYAKNQWGISNGYEDVVQYPFGYGLSYTTFSWEITYLSLPNNTTLSKDSSISIQVKVTNTGATSGQDVVELYYTAPYTENGVEKSSVVLGAFTKTTEVLQSGESQIVELTMYAEDMKSYDCYNLSGSVGDDGGYVLEAGEYTLTLRSDAHTVADDKMVDGVYDSATLTYRVSADIVYDTDTETGAEVSNHFTGSDATDGVALDGNSDGSADITYITRSDMTNTFPSERAENRAMTSEVMDLNLYDEEDANAYIDESDEDIVTGASTGGLVYEDGAITDLGIELAKNPDDEALWSEVLDRTLISEMTNLVLHGYVHTRALDSIGKYETYDLDGPNQIGSYASKKGTTGFSSIVLAQSWNVELAYSMGLTVAAECATLSVNGWYGPGINLHRSPFSGRNFEYYSEDSLISGLMCANEVKAAKNGGVYCYLKHLCLYETETGRDSMYVWTTEQALRENYLKPFEIAIKDGGATGIMTSYGRIGAVWTGGSYALLTEVVRNEWGFQGGILTDYADHHNFMNADQMLRAGGDLWMDGVSQGSFQFETSSNSFKQALRRATKHVVYMWLDALATNVDYNERIANGEVDGVAIITSSPELNFRWYIPVLIVVDVVAVAGCGVWIFLSFRKKDKGADAQ